MNIMRIRSAMWREAEKQHFLVERIESSISALGIYMNSIAFFRD